MMYDVYWYYQMKKKRMIMKILKKEWFIRKFWKKGGSREKGEEETKSMSHAPLGPTSNQISTFIFHSTFDYYFKFNIRFQQIGDLYTMVSHEDH